jgi:hypothetical protein
MGCSAVYMDLHMRDAYLLASFATGSAGRHCFRNHNSELLVLWLLQVVPCNCCCAAVAPFSVAAAVLLLLRLLLLCLTWAPCLS